MHLHTEIHNHQITEHTDVNGSSRTDRKSAAEPTAGIDAVDREKGGQGNGRILDINT